MCTGTTASSAAASRPTRSEAASRPTRYTSHTVAAPMIAGDGPAGAVDGGKVELIPATPSHRVTRPT